VDDPKHRRTPRRPTRAVLTVVKGASLGALLSIVVVGGLHTGSPNADTSQRASDAYERVVERAVAAHNCSFEGYGDSAIPESALIRTSQGELRQVSFEVGWDVYNGRRPGTLIAVCLEDPDDGGLVEVQHSVG
jgi:hypothetical protein